MLIFLRVNVCSKWKVGTGTGTGGEARLEVESKLQEILRDGLSCFGDSFCRTV